MGRRLALELSRMGLPETAREFGSADVVREVERSPAWLAPGRVLVAWCRALGVDVGHFVRVVTEWT